MAYIGNQVSSVPFIIDTFSGTGSASVFGQLTRAPASVASIAVFISGVYKTPGVDYTLNGDLILFTTPPALGTNNIIIHHMGNGSATQVPSDGSVTTAKLAANTVRGNNILAGIITSNHIAVGAITGNLIPVGAITANQIVARSISGNTIGLNSVAGNNIVAASLTSNAMNSNVAITNFTANTTFKLPVFASNTTRDSTITAPQAGMMVFVTTGTQFQGHTGSGWISLSD
jgi:hypothetical protein